MKGTHITKHLPHNVQKAGGSAAVRKVELRGSDGGGWQSMNNVWGASWEMGQMPQPPLSVRITDDQGNSVCKTRRIQAEGNESLHRKIYLMRST